MSAKNLDSKGRFRARTIGFRVSPEEDQLINSAVALSGLTKQDYIVKRLLCRDVVVQGNPRVYKALKNQLAEVLSELQRIENSSVSDELLETIRLINTTLNGMNEFFKKIDPSYMKTVTMQELYQDIYSKKPPVIEGLLYCRTESDTI